MGGANERPYKTQNVFDSQMRVDRTCPLNVAMVASSAPSIAEEASPSISR